MKIRLVTQDGDILLDATVLSVSGGSLSSDDADSALVVTVEEPDQVEPSVGLAWGGSATEPEATA